MRVHMDIHHLNRKSRYSAGSHGIFLTSVITLVLIVNTGGGEIRNILLFLTLTVILIG